VADVTDEGFYIYGLIDPAVRRQTKDDLLSVFYVGKGKNERWRDHEQDELLELRRELDLVTRGSKAEHIRKILDRGEEIPRDPPFQRIQGLERRRARAQAMAPGVRDPRRRRSDGDLGRSGSLTGSARACTTRLATVVTCEHTLVRRQNETGWVARLTY